MAESFPRSPRPVFLSWCASHQVPWQDNTAAIGLTPANVTAYKAAVADAIAAEQEAQDARNSAKASTEKANQLCRDLLQLTSDNNRRIKQKALDTSDPNVYVLAQIPAPSAPGTALPPAKPTDISVSISPTGAPVL